MNNILYPCFWYNGQAKEAAQLYIKAFDNGTITDDTGAVVILELFGQKLMGLNGGPEFTMNPSISLFVTLPSEKAVEKAWEKLIDGGKSLMELNTYPWAQKYGWVQDSYGLSWQLSYSDHHQFGQTITPALLFTGKEVGKAKEAMKRYIQIFPHSKIHAAIHYEEQDGDNPKYLKHGLCSLNGYSLIAMDSSYDHKFSFNEGISLTVSCDGQKEVDHYWNALTADGGKESQCGWLKDPYGVSWQIVPKQLMEALGNPDPKRAKHAMDAMMKMKKIIIKEL